MSEIIPISDIFLPTAQSPISSALLGNEEGDEVIVKAPIGDIIYEILEVQYI